MVIVNVTPKYLREKIERVALDLVKLENETFSLAALKLLVTCMYMGEFGSKRHEKMTMKFHSFDRLNRFCRTTGDHRTVKWHRSG